MHGIIVGHGSHDYNGRGYKVRVIKRDILLQEPSNW